MKTIHAVAALAVAAASAVQAMITCDSNHPCPSTAPCCSSYRFCGVGAYCLGGCYPKDSFSIDSCMPAPVCKSSDYDFSSMNGFIENTDYLGDPSSGNWVFSGDPLMYNNEAVLLTMTSDSSGTLLSSTRYVWYGKMSATMKTSRGAGVVTAFIMMSDVKDEIDFEFIGTDIETAQSNYYFQGITDYGNEKNLSAPNTDSTWHTYTIDWQPDSLSWEVDGKVLRTLYRNETYNATAGQYHYPQTPSRVQFSLWPAGKAGNAQGTIEWAGGEIDWNSPYMQNGYYYAMVKDVTVDCYNPPSGYNNQGNKAYWYENKFGTNDTVVVGNNNTILSSFLATGEDPNKGASSSKSSTATKTGSSSADSATAQPETIPGVSGGGSRESGSDVASGSSSSGNSGSSGSSGSSDSGSYSGGPSSFSQGLETGSGTNDGNRVVAGSLVALVAFFAAAMML